MFVTDTVDAIYHPDNWFPEAMMDQLAEIVGALPVAVGLAFKEILLSSHGALYQGDNKQWIYYAAPRNDC